MAKSSKPTQEGHKASPEDIARRDAFVLELCKKQGITLEQLYHQVPSVAEKAKKYTERSKWCSSDSTDG